jgi:hypothetical protein
MRRSRRRAILRLVHMTFGRDQTNARVTLMTGNSVGLSVMLPEDLPTIARWNQDLEFTARIGTPGEAHTLEMRQEAYNRNSRFRR